MDPRPAPGALANITLSTPLVVIGMLVAAIRERFKEGNPSGPLLNWVWRPVLDQTEVFIESGWNTNIEARTARPGIWVDRAQNVYRQGAIGSQDQVSMSIPATLEMYHCFGETDIVVDCTSPNRGESMMIGSIVQDFVQMSSFIIERFFGLRRISDVILNQTGTFEEDDTLWNSQVQFRIYYETRWATMPVVGVFNSLGARFSEAEDPDAIIREILVQHKKQPNNP